jgi:hypothetical protein
MTDVTTIPSFVIFLSCSLMNWRIGRKLLRAKVEILPSVLQSQVSEVSSALCLDQKTLAAGAGIA